MGIRFHCPNGHRLHVKQELAGQVGICPQCEARVEIPAASTPPGDTLPDQGAPAHPGEAAPAEPAVQPAPQGLPRALPRALPITPEATPAAAAAPQPQSPPQSPPPPPPADPPTDTWRLQTESGQQRGPGDESLLAAWREQGLLTDDSHVWRAGWPEWRRVGDVRQTLPLPRPPVSTQPAPNQPSPSPPHPAPRNTASPQADASSRYVLHRQRAAKRQMLVAGLLVVLVIGVAIALTLVLRSSSIRAAPEADRNAPAPCVWRQCFNRAEIICYDNV